MIFSTIKTTMKRVFRSPAMLFCFPAIVIMLQQRTQIFGKGGVSESFIQGGYHITFLSWYPSRYFAFIELFNAVLVPLTKCMPIIIAVILALIIKDLYNQSERDILFATNMSFSKYFISKMVCVFVLSVLIYLLFAIAYFIFIVPKLTFGIKTWELIKITLVKMAGMGLIGIVTYMSIGVLVTAITKKAIAGSASIVLYSMIETHMMNIRFGSTGIFWSYFYFPQMKLWPSFYMNGTQWHQGMVNYFEIGKYDLWICAGITLVFAIISFGTAYFIFNKDRFTQKRRGRIKGQNAKVTEE